MKRIISIIIFLAILMVGVITIAEQKDNINFEQAKLLLIKNNSTLQTLANTKKQAQLDYYEADIDSKILQNRLDSLLDRNRISEYDEIQLRKQIELTSSKARSNYDILRNNLNSTRNNLVIGLRDTYLGLYKAAIEVDIKEKELNLAEKELSQALVQFSKGLISNQQTNEYEYNLLKAEMDLDIAKRNKDNLTRNLNLFSGIPVAQKYNNISIAADIIMYEEEYKNMELLSSDEYLEKALSNRNEIIKLETDIDLKEQELKILEMKDVHIRYADGRSDYEKATNELASLELKLENLKQDIEKEIKTAIFDINLEKQNVEHARKELDIQKRSLEEFKLQYLQGNISKLDLDKLDLNVEELKDNLEIAMYQYVTKIMKLDAAIGIGPAY